MKVNGKGHEMEAALVHKSQDGKLLIIAVPLDVGAENPVLKDVLANLPANKGKEQLVSGVTINALGLLPKDKGYYMYTGSLASPPCTENILWYVLKNPATASADQMARFGRVYPMNSRPTQPRNDRDIIGTP
jgi:carbonic anhydrase